MNPLKYISSTKTNSCVDRWWYLALVVKLVDTRDLKSLDFRVVPVQVRPGAPSSSKKGALAEWLCSGLQIRGPRFDSGTRLHFSILFPEYLNFLISLWLVLCICTVGLFCCYIYCTDLPNISIQSTSSWFCSISNGFGKTKLVRGWWSSQPNCWNTGISWRCKSQRDWKYLRYSFRETLRIAISWSKGWCKTKQTGALMCVSVVLFST